MYTFIWCFLTKLNDLPITFNLQEKVMMKIVKMTARKVVEWTTLPLRMTSIPLKVAFNNYVDPILTPHSPRMDILPFFYTLSCDPLPSSCPLNYWMPPEDECTNNDSTNDDCQPSKINPNASVNFNMEGLKDMLKCANCHRFLFPPILQ